MKATTVAIGEAMDDQRGNTEGAPDDAPPPRIRLRRPAVIVGVVVALAVVGGVVVNRVATASSDHRGRSTNAGTRGVVLFAGDSNITLSLGAINLQTTMDKHLDNGYVPVFTSRDGASIRTSDCSPSKSCTTHNYWRIKLRAILQKVKPDAIVTDLGINDTLTSGTETGPGFGFYDSKIDWFMRLVPRGTPVFWTNLPCDIEPAGRSAGCRAVNNALARAPKRWRNLMVIDWASVADTHPGYIADVVHYSPTGSEAWAATVVQALDAYLAPPN